MAKKKDENKEVVKQKPKTGRGGTHNFPTTLEGSKKEDVQRIGKNLMRWYGMEKAVSDEEIRDRLTYFFTTCFENGEVPTVEKMSLALGYDRATIWRWETGGDGSTPMRSQLIKKAKELLASFDAEMVTEGKINPVTYIFRAKNYFGMVDKQEHVLTPNNPLGEINNPDDIKQRLLESLPEPEEDE